MNFLVGGTLCNALGTKPPKIDQWRYRRVVCAVGRVVDIKCRIEYESKIPIDFHHLHSREPVQFAQRRSRAIVVHALIHHRERL